MFRHVDKAGFVFERRSYRVPGEKYPKAETKCIGKMVDGEFCPNAYFTERTAKENLEKELKSVREQLESLTEELKKEEKKEKKPVEVASKAVSSIKKEGCGSIIRVGTTEGRFRMVMPRLMRELKENNSGYDIRGVIGSAEELRDMLEKGEIDIAFSGLTPSTPECIERELLFEERLYLVASEELLRKNFPHDYPMCIERFKDGVDISLFNGMDFSLSLEHLHCMKLLSRLLEEESVVLNSVHTSPHFDLHQEMARENIAFCFSLSMYLPYLYERNKHSSNKLFAFPIKNLRETNPVYILTNKEKKHNDGVESFKALLRGIVKGLDR